MKRYRNRIIIAVIFLAMVIVFFYFIRDEVIETNSNLNENTNTEQATETCREDIDCKSTCPCGCIHIDENCPDEGKVACGMIPECFCQEGECQELSKQNLNITNQWTADDCLKYSSPNTSSFCLDELSLFKNDQSICLYTVNNVEGYLKNDFLDLVRDRADCINQVAQQNNNTSLCQLINEELITDISDNVDSEGKRTFIANADTILESQQNYCFWSIAADLDDASICDSMENDTIKDGCYKYLAGAIQNSQYCKEIGDAVVKDNCFSDIATMSKNKDYCENINSHKIKTKCLSYFGE